MRLHSAFPIFYIVALLISGCSTTSYQSFKTVSDPDLGKIYKKAAEYAGPERNPVIVIPGFLGSRLVNSKSKELVWGSFEIQPLIQGGEQLLKLKAKEVPPLSLPMEWGKTLKELRDDVVPDGVLEKVEVSFVGLPLHMAAYSFMLEGLKNGGYLEERSSKTAGITDEKRPYDCFQFDYDWRRDIVENVKLLHAFIQAKRTYLQKEYEKRYGIKDHDIKFDIVAHSMAGLLSRYYLLYGDADLPEDGTLPKVTWKGSRWVHKLIVVGTPNAGMLDAFTELVGGIRFSAVLPKYQYDPAVLGTWPAYYELLPYEGTHAIVDAQDPAGPALDIFDPELWIQMKWGLADPKQESILAALLPGVNSALERREIALDHLKKCLKRAKQLSQALNVNAKPPRNVRIHLFAGDTVSTKKTVAVDRMTGATKALEYGPGDGVVLRSSALFDKRNEGERTPRLQSPIRWSSVTFLSGAHMAITKESTFTDNVLYLLLEDPS